MIFSFIRTVITYLLIGIAMAACLPPAIFILLLPEKYRYNNRVLFFLLYLLYKIALKVSFLPKSIKGLDNILKTGPVIFVANHQSSIDIPIVGYLTNGKPHIWLVLSYYENRGILGFFIRRLFVPIDNTNKFKSAKSLVNLLSQAKKYPADIIIFPEAGRFTDGKIHKFYDGFALVAQKTGYPVIPVYMENNGKIYPPHNFLINNYTIKVIIGNPFVYNNSIDTLQSFTESVFQWFVKKNQNI